VADDKRKNEKEKQKLEEQKRGQDKKADGDKKTLNGQKKGMEKEKEREAKEGKKADDRAREKAKEQAKKENENAKAKDKDQDKDKDRQRKDPGDKPKPKSGEPGAKEPETKKDRDARKAKEEEERKRKEAEKKAQRGAGAPRADKKGKEKKSKEEKKEEERTAREDQKKKDRQAADKKEGGKKEGDKKEDDKRVKESDKDRAARKKAEQEAKAKADAEGKDRKDKQPGDEKDKKTRDDKDRKDKKPGDVKDKANGKPEDAKRQSRSPGAPGPSAEDGADDKFLIGVLLLISFLAMLGGRDGPRAPGGIVMPPRASGRRASSFGSRWIVDEQPRQVINNVNAQGSGIPINIGMTPPAAPVIDDASGFGAELHFTGPADPGRLFAMLAALLVVGAPLLIDYLRDWPNRQADKPDYLSATIHYVLLGFFGLFCLWKFNREYGYIARMRPTFIRATEGFRRVKVDVRPTVVAVAQGAEQVVWGVEDAIFGDGRELLGLGVAAVSLIFLVHQPPPSDSPTRSDYAAPPIQAMYVLGGLVLGMIFWNA
jgi:hypothetical protein